MFKTLIDRLKINLKLKDIIIWFILSFICILFIFLFLLKQPFDSYLLIEVTGFSFVFVCMLIGTKSYSHFLEGYQKSFKK